MDWAAECNGLMAALRIVSAITADAGKLLFQRNLTEQVGQHRSITDAVVGHFHGPDFSRGSINTEMDFAPLAAVVSAVLFGLPFTVAQHLDAGAVDQQVQAGRGRHDFGSDTQCLLPAAHGAVIRNRSIQTCQPKQALRHAHRLA